MYIVKPLGPGEFGFAYSELPALVHEPATDGTLLKDIGNKTVMLLLVLAVIAFPPWLLSKCKPSYSCIDSRPGQCRTAKCHRVNTNSSGNYSPHIKVCTRMHGGQSCKRGGVKTYWVSNGVNTTALLIEVCSPLDVADQNQGGNLPPTSGEGAIQLPLNYYKTLAVLAIYGYTAGTTYIGYGGAIVSNHQIKYRLSGSVNGGYAIVICVA